MRYRILGQTGLEVSEVGFGGTGVGMRNYLHEWDPSNGDQRAEGEKALVRSVELGINYFDTAPLYGGSEELYGRVLKPYRDRIFYASKVRETTADAVRRSVEGSLGRLQTDHIDVMQYHGEWYTKEIMHDFMKPGGILEGLQAVKDEGLVRFIGFTSQGVDGGVSQLIETGVLDVMQIQYNVTFQHPYDPEKQAGVMFEAEAQEMGIVVMRTFTGGTFMRWMAQIAPDLEKQVDVPKALLSFVLSNPVVDVALADMRKVEWVEANCATSDDHNSRVDLDALYGRFIRKNQ